MKKALAIVTMLGVLWVLSEQASAGSRERLNIVQNVDLNKYSGKWYEIARLPNFFERKCATDVTAQYTLQDNGHIDVLNSCQRGDGTHDTARGVGKPAQPNSNAGHFKVTFAPAMLRFIPAVWADYCIIELDSDYQYALVGEPSRRYLWILSRQAKMDEALYEQLLSAARKQGYDTSRMIRSQ